MSKNNNDVNASLSTDKARILIIDDEPRLLDSLKSLLANYNYAIDTALGGVEACRKLLKQHFDLVLVDLNMVDMNGHQVMDFIIKKEIQTSIIVISGESSFTAVSKALRRGAHDYLRKPYAKEELLATMEKALQKQVLQKSHISMQTRLQQSEELHRYIVNSSPDIVFMLDTKGDFTFVNNKIETLLGYTRSELLGKNYKTIIAKVDHERANYIFNEQSLKKSGSWNSELRLKAKNDEYAPRHFEVTLFPIENNTQGERYISFNNSEGSLISIYGTARDITERKEAEEFINFQAYHDLLTRLPNRALFKDRLNLAIAHAKRNDHMLAVMFLDLDRFKIVNDTLGHAMGDRLLQSVALRLENCVRKCDTLSRFGGDEFTLLLPLLSSKEDARIIARKIITALKEPFNLGDNEVYVGVSIGIATLPQAGSTVDQLIQHADIAMYHVKGRDKEGYQFYSDSMSVEFSDRLQWEREIRIALEECQFRVYYQSQVDINKGQITGIEALVRWQHPQKGLLYPGSFVPLAEETKLMSHISDWVLKTACTEVAQWISNGHPDLRLSVNFSPLQVEHPRFVPNLIQLLNTIGFPPQNLCVEITENVLMNDLENMKKKMSQLSEHGVTFAIDDFGTGYSSLSYLRKLPIHTLKVDRSFVQDIQHGGDDICIVNAIVSMAHGLKLNIVAEGVETKAQLDYLIGLGCHQIQGFYFGRPMPGEIIREQLDIDIALIADQENGVSRATGGASQSA